jgi:signal transduction histidine kinase
VRNQGFPHAHCRRIGATVAGRSVGQPSQFADLVSLACHDLRTPLATVAGFAGTLARDDDLGEQQARYVGMIEAASGQLAGLLDTLAIVARIEAGRYEPALEDIDTFELAQNAVVRLGEGRASAGGQGAIATVDPDATDRALAALALAALRHGSLERVELEVAQLQIRIGPVTPHAAPIVLAEDLRDLGAAAATRIVAALGGDLRLEGSRLLVTLPPTGAAATAGGP